jgi:hypothetical protein
LTLGDRPLAVITAGKGSASGWRGEQDNLATLSSNSEHRTVAGSTHQSLIDDEGDAAHSSQAIGDVVAAVRSRHRHRSHHLGVHWVRFSGRSNLRPSAYLSEGLTVGRVPGSAAPGFKSRAGVCRRSRQDARTSSVASVTRATAGALAHCRGSGSETGFATSGGPEKSLTGNQRRWKKGTDELRELFASNPS